MDTHNWSEVQGNKFLTKPSPEMIEEIKLRGEYKRLRNCSVKGETKYKKTRGDCKYIAYDNAYLVAYLDSRLGSLLDIPYNELQQYIKQARALHKEKDKA